MGGVPTNTTVVRPSFTLCPAGRYTAGGPERLLLRPDAPRVGDTCDRRIRTLLWGSRGRHCLSGRVAVTPSSGLRYSGRGPMHPCDSDHCGAPPFSLEGGRTGASACRGTASARGPMLSHCRERHLVPTVRLWQRHRVLRRGRMPGHLRCGTRRPCASCRWS